MTIATRTKGDDGRTEPVGVAICGLGRAGWHLHAEALPRLDGCCRVVAAFDLHVGRMQEAAARFGFQPPPSFEAMLQNPAVELVIVAVPTHLHEPLALAALGARKHVIVEKPFTTSFESAARMVDTAEDADRLLTCSQNLRFFPDFVKVRDVIDSGKAVKLRLKPTSKSGAPAKPRGETRAECPYAGAAKLQMSAAARPFDAGTDVKTGVLLEEYQSSIFPPRRIE